MSSFSDELVLLERVFLRIGSADTDEQLEQSLNRFLPPVLLKLSSNQEEVRKKVMELLTHINKRVKTRPQVLLPVDSLVLQYQDPAASVFLTNFTIIYIKMGFPRLSPQKQAELIPAILNSLEEKPQSHQESLLLLVVQAMQHIQWPSDPAKRQAMFNISEKPIVKKLLSQAMMDVLLMPYGWAAMPPPPPGLSQYIYNKLLTDLGPSQTPETLEALKLGVVKFLSSDVLTDGETLCPLIVGAADARFAVTNSADLQIRKIMGGIEWDSVSVLAPLFSVYMGSKDGPAESQKAPASIRLRLKLLPYMCKARKQAILWPASIRVLFDSLYGENTHAKLKAQALTFCSVIIQQVSVAQLSVIASVMLTSGLMKLISESDSEPGLKQQAYLTAGQLVNKVPSLVKKDLSLLQTLFSVLCQEENTEVRMSVREALLTMANAFSVDVEDQNLLMALLTTQVESPSPAARLVAVRYLATVFPQTHALSRVYLLIAAGDSQEEIASEALKSLYGASYKLAGDGKGDSTASSVQFPDFVEMVTVVLEKAHVREENINCRLLIKNQKLAFNLAAYNQFVVFLSLCLAEKCGVKTNCQRLQHPCESTVTIGEFLRKLYSTHKQMLDTYITFMFKLVKADLAVLPVSCLLEFVGCIPDVLASSFKQELNWFKKVLSDSREDVRDVAAQLIGAVAGFSAGQSKELAQLIALVFLESKDLETQHGHLLATGYSVERAVVCLSDTANSNLYQNAVLAIVPFLKHPHSMLVGAATTAIAEIARVVPLPLPDSKTEDFKKPGLQDVVDKLLNNIVSTKITSKVKERSCRAAGMLCLSETFAFRQNTIDFFLNNIKEVKDVEIQLSIGEALVCCVLGPSSPMRKDLWTGIKPEAMSSYDPEPACSALVLKLLKDVLPSPHPHSRQSCCIWLLALLKHCGFLKAMRNNLMDIQRGFMELLSENNDIVQDVASKGLALVYESGDEGSRAALVNLLVDQLTVGKRSVTQVTKDTKLFEEGSLGKAPTGGNLSTYQELCSLASDLNQPDLIYKFMHLANHNAIWNSKKGAAFGFSTIAKAAGEQLTSHLPKILPRLYRYQFDPTPKIQQSMASIWQALVPETNKTVELYHKEIFEDLIHNLTSNQWRVRTSCCLALSDFMRGGGSKVFQNCPEMMPKLWSQLFRVMDDVHEGTRQAANSTTRIFSKLCVQSCDPDKGKAGEAMVKTILPTILEVGICHQVSEIRGVSVQTVSQLVKSAGPLLKPHLPLLIPALLEAAGELEPLALNHLSVRLAGDQRSQDIVDTMRATVAKSHYTTETVSKCVQYIDETTFGEMMPRLLELLKLSVGLGTRVATAHFIVLISHHLTIEQFQPSVGKLLSALFSGLTDRNSTIRRTCANSIGQIVRSAKPSSIDNLLTKLNTNYMEKEDESMRTAVGLTLQAIARHNQDLIKSRSDVVIPLVFFAMHTTKNKEDAASVSNWDLWQDVWHEVSPGMEAALTRHLDQVLNLLSSVMQSPSWHVKAQAARSIETLASKVGGSLEPDKLDTLVNLLLSGLSGRTWDGKEQLLIALGSLCKHSSSSLKGSASAGSIVDALLRECSKEKVSYKSVAMTALGEVLESLEEDRFQQVYSIVQEILVKELDSEENEKQEETSKRREELLTLREVAFTTLGKAWPRSEKTQAEFREQVVAQCVSCLENNTRSVQVKIMTAVLNYCDKLYFWDRAVLDNQDSSALHNILDQLTPTLLYALGLAKHTLLRKESLNVLFSLAKNCKKLNQLTELKRLESVFLELYEELNKDNSPEIKSRVVDMKDFFSNLSKD